MPLFACSCQHEWEGTKSDKICSWCGQEGYILQEKTPLEKLIESLMEDNDDTS